VTKPKKKRRLRAADTLSLPVWKTVFKFTAYSNRQLSPHADLADVIADCTDGDSIGEAEILEQKTIEPRCVRRALCQIGNDGTFFDRVPDDKEKT
jgi:hypothetical protein